MVKEIIETQAYIPLLMGLGFIIWGILYKKSHHEKVRTRNKDGGGNTGNIFGDIIYEILAYLPWYVLKILLIIFGLIFIKLCFMSI